MRVAGVDEAGRGSAIGPLVVAGASFPEDKIPRLIELGVKDSKQLTRARREELAPQIRELASGVQFFDLQPSAIDAVVNRGVRLRRLNYLEAVAMACVIRDLRPDAAYVDASDVDEQRYSETILRLLPSRPRLVCEHKADSTYPVVSAASILAKVRRDELVALLRDEYGDFNSGYPSDGRAIDWLEAYYAEHRCWPNIVRRSWAPVKRIERDAAQTRLANASA
ncbi:MAG: ribonuclease HII [Candidatus Bathyarchaeota archaeon]|nr:ribonuclease HII [Candidatus Bathyarchaeota archaeon]